MTRGLLLLLALAACGHQIARPPLPVEGVLVGPEPLAEPIASVSFDILLPADGDMPSALELARTTVESAGFELVTGLPDLPKDPMVSVQLLSFSVLNWSGKKLPGYVEAWVKQDEQDAVFASVGIVRLQLRGPSSRALDSLIRFSNACREIAAAQQAWIFDSYRAQLHTVMSFADWIPDPEDVETIVRVVGVTSKTEPSHVRTMGFARLGLPELYVPAIVREPDLDVARYLMRAAAQTYLNRRGMTRRGRLHVDMASLTPDWKAEDGSGKFEFEARWIRGPIKERLIIELSIPGGSRDPAIFAAALRRFVVHQE